MFGFILRTLYLSNSIYCGMIGINDSSRFVVFVGSYSRTLQARQKQMKKEEQFGFFTQTENRRILEITSPRKSKKKTKQKNPPKTENSALAILNDSQAFLYQHVNVSYLTIL